MIDIQKLKASLPIELGKIELFGETFDVCRNSDIITNRAVGIAYRSALANMPDSISDVIFGMLGGFVALLFIRRKLKNHT